MTLRPVSGFTVSLVVRYFHDYYGHSAPMSVYADQASYPLLETDYRFSGSCKDTLTDEGWFPSMFPISGLED
jgi:hypothetical protein